jgi:hypothetical protein
MLHSGIGIIIATVPSDNAPSGGRRWCHIVDMATEGKEQEIYNNAEKGQNSACRVRLHSISNKQHPVKVSLAGRRISGDPETSQIILPPSAYGPWMFVEKMWTSTKVTTYPRQRFEGLVGKTSVGKNRSNETDASHY